MTIFQTEDSGRRAAAAPWRGPPASVGEITALAWADSRLNDMSLSSALALEPEYEKWIADVETATGQDLRQFSPFVREDSVPDRAIDIVNDQPLRDEIERLRTRFTFIPTRSRDELFAAAGLRRSGAREASATAREGVGLVGAIADFAGRAAVLTLDPPVLASMVIGAPAQATILRTALIEAGIATATEIPIQIAVQSQRRAFGESPSLREAVIAIGGAAAGGAVIGGGIRAARPYASRLLARAGRAVGGRPAELPASAQRAAAFLDRLQSVDEATPFIPTPAAAREHRTRFDAAEQALREQRAPDLPPPVELVRPTRAQAAAVADTRPAFDELLEAVRAGARASREEEMLRLAFAHRAPGEVVELLQQVQRPPNVAKPQSLTQFLVNRGGVADPRGDLRAVIGGAKSRPGLVNDASGAQLDDAAVLAFEEGFFPGRSERPDINDLLEAIDRDLHEVPVLRESDFAALDDVAFTRGLEELDDVLSGLGLDVREVGIAATQRRIDELIAARPAPGLDEGAMVGANAVRPEVARLAASEGVDDIPALEREIDELFDIDRSTGAGGDVDLGVPEILASLRADPENPFGKRIGLELEPLATDLETLLRSQGFQSVELRTHGAEALVLATDDPARVVRIEPVDEGASLVGRPQAEGVLQPAATFAVRRGEAAARVEILPTIEPEFRPADELIALLDRQNIKLRDDVGENFARLAGGEQVVIDPGAIDVPPNIRRNEVEEFGSDADEGVEKAVQAFVRGAAGADVERIVADAVVRLGRQADQATTVFRGFMGGQPAAREGAPISVSPDIETARSFSLARNDRLAEEGQPLPVAEILVPAEARRLDPNEFGGGRPNEVELIMAGRLERTDTPARVVVEDDGFQFDIQEFRLIPDDSARRATVDDRIWIEDDNGNPVQVSVRETLDELEQDEVFLNEWLNCAGGTA